MLELLRAACRSSDFRLFFGPTGAILALGTVFFRVQEDLSWVDALYLSVMTRTTVGYGDIAPESDGAKRFTIAYLLLGLGVMAAFVGVVADLAVAVGTRRTASTPERAEPSDQ